MSRLLQVVFAGNRKTGGVDLEAIETLVRNSMHRAGAAVLAQVLSVQAPPARKVACTCGHQAHYHKNRRKQLLTMLGTASFQRPDYVCAHCHPGQSPRDQERDVVGTECSPGVRRMMAMVGSEGSFGIGRQQLQLLAGLEVTPKAVERHAEAIGADMVEREQKRRDRMVQLEFPDILGAAVPVMYIEMDGTQLPMVRAELQGRAGRTQGQPPRTREVKPGCVFTQTATTAALFGRRLYAEAFERGWDGARKKVVLGDGAEWIWNMADQHFAGATQIVDIGHAREHLGDLAAKLFPSHEKQRKRWAKKLIQKINRGRIETLVAELRSFRTGKPELR